MRYSLTLHSFVLKKVKIYFSLELKYVEFKNRPE